MQFKLEDRCREDTYSNFFFKKVFECQHQTPNHFGKKQGVYTSLKNCNHSESISNYSLRRKIKVPIKYSTYLNSSPLKSPLQVALFLHPLQLLQQNHIGTINIKEKSIMQYGNR